MFTQSLISTQGYQCESFVEPVKSQKRKELKPLLWLYRRYLRFLNESGKVMDAHPRFFDALSYGIAALLSLCFTIGILERL